MLKKRSELPLEVQRAFEKLYWPAKDSHKGQNGKLLILGGSELFHAASRWSLDIASRVVDMVFYSSVSSNNQLIARYFAEKKQVEEAKAAFWDGIVIVEKHIEHYLEEADCVLIGPGMDRSQHTEEMTNRLLKKFPEKKWVIDAGALQMVQPQLLNNNCIITPHHQEFALLQKKSALFDVNNYQAAAYCILKGEVDQIFQPQKKTSIRIKGGNPGMSKGGTGDVLAGLTAALYCRNDALTSAIVASFVNKYAGDQLFEKKAVYFNASDLVESIPSSLAELQRLFL